MTSVWRFWRHVSHLRSLSGHHWGPTWLPKSGWVNAFFPHLPPLPGLWTAGSGRLFRARGGKGRRGSLGEISLSPSLRAKTFLASREGEVAKKGKAAPPPISEKGATGGAQPLKAQSCNKRAEALSYAGVARRSVDLERKPLFPPGVGAE